MWLSSQKKSATHEGCANFHQRRRLEEATNETEKPPTATQVWLETLRCARNFDALHYSRRDLTSTGDRHERIAAAPCHLYPHLLVQVRDVLMILTHRAWREAIGLFWYRIKFRFT